MDDPDDPVRGGNVAFLESTYRYMQYILLSSFVCQSDEFATTNWHRYTVRISYGERERERERQRERERERERDRERRAHTHTQPAGKTRGDGNTTGPGMSQDIPGDMLILVDMLLSLAKIPHALGVSMRFLFSLSAQLRSGMPGAVFRFTNSQGQVIFTDTGEAVALALLILFVWRMFLLYYN